MPADQLTVIRRGSLPLPELLIINEHVRGCAGCARQIALASSCRRRAGGVRRVIEAEDEATFHILFDELAAHAGDRLEANRAEIVDAHVQFCSTCAEDLGDLRSLQDCRAMIGLARWNSWLGAAAAILFVAATIVLTSRREQRRPDPPRQLVASPAAPAEVARPPAPASAPEPYGRADWNLAVTAARQSGRFQVSAELAAMRHSRGTLRNAREIEPLPRAFSPDREFVDTPRPMYRWQAPAGTTSVVVISGANGLELSSEPLSVTSWQPARDLKPGITYSWQVEITHGKDVLLVPRAPGPPALFRVLMPHAREELAGAKQRFPDDHLLLAVLYARHGVLAGARAELEAYIAAENPRHAVSMRNSLEHAGATPRESLENRQH